MAYRAPTLGGVRPAKIDSALSSDAMGRRKSRSARLKLRSTRRTPMPISDSVDNYLKAIYQLAGDDGWVAPSQIAARLEIASSSVTGMLQRLGEGLPAQVEYRKGRGARLTPRGRVRAVEMVRHHRLLELYLYQELGTRWTKSTQKPRRWSMRSRKSWKTDWRPRWATLPSIPTVIPFLRRTGRSKRFGPDRCLIWRWARQPQW